MAMASSSSSSSSCCVLAFPASATFVVPSKLFASNGNLPFESNIFSFKVVDSIVLSYPLKNFNFCCSVSHSKNYTTPRTGCDGGMLNRFSIFRKGVRFVVASVNETEKEADVISNEEIMESQANNIQSNRRSAKEKPDGFSKELSKAVKKSASTFAPRASTAQKNPAVPGSILYTVFEVQGYLSMALGGLLSFNLIFPSNEPDIWRLMGMWSVWMFTIPSLRARDCSSKEKDALNYLFLAIPLINVVIPFFWKSFGLVWSVDLVTFLAVYAWKLDWLEMVFKADKPLD